LINNAEHVINLKDKSKVISLPNRRLPLAYEDKVENIIKDLLVKGVIHKSNSSFNSPIVLVPKKDGDIRLCIDYRHLNDNTEKPSFYFPDPQEIFDKLGGNTYFTTLDLVKGYYQLKMNLNSTKYTAFTTPSGHYEFARMPFGLCGAPFSFQAALHNILSDEDRQTCFIYLDDIIIFGKNRFEHDKNLIKILNKLNSAGIKLSKNKCNFSTTSVKYLGHKISSKGIETDTAKTEQIKNWPVPKSIKEIQSFLGLANYYRKFVRGFSEISAPLESCLSKKFTKFQWTNDMQQSFEAIKERLVSAPVLKYPSNTDIFILDTDASSTGIGAVLSQRDKEGNENVIYYASNRLSKTEQNYCTTRKELLAIYHYTKFFRHYLLGRRFIIRTDHKSLTWLMSWKNPSSSQYFSWISEISQFDFSIQHREGAKHNNADALSRLHECKQCPFKHKENNANTISTMTQMPLLNNIKQNCPINKEILSKHLGTINNDEIEQILKYKDKIFIKRGNAMIETKTGIAKILKHCDGIEIAKKLHSSLCHLGSERMLSSLERHVFWPTMKKDCKNISNGCLICAQRKAIKPISYETGSLNAFEPFEKVFMDIAGPLPNCMGYRYILAITDSFSKFVSLQPLKSTYSKDICETFEKHWISIFGPPSQLHTDNGTNFSSNELKQLCEKYYIKKTFTSPYNPRGNGMVERLFRTVKDMAYCSHKETGKSWPKSLHKISLALNLTSSSNKCSAYELLFGRSPVRSQENLKGFIPSSVLEKSANIFIETYNASKEKTHKEPLIKKGDQVMVRILPRIKQIDTPRFSGPFVVVETKSNGRAIFVKTLDNRIIQRNIRDIKPFTGIKEEVKYEIDPCVSERRSKTRSRENAQPTVVNRRYPQRKRIIMKKFGFE